LSSFLLFRLFFACREYAYEIRVKILDALDVDANYDNIESGKQNKEENRERYGLAR
jgi:hypothetical protein